MGSEALAEQVLPPGMKLAYEVMTPQEEAELIALMETADLRRFPYDLDNPRSSASYGWKFNFPTDSFLACAPMPEGYRTLAARAAALAGLEPEDLAECLLNRYEPGATIAPHLDKTVWATVIGVSLGARVVMDMRQVDGEGQIPVTLPPRSIYLLAGDARYAWKHGLPAMTETRWSITFRSFSPEGLERLEACSSEI